MLRVYTYTGFALTGRHNGARIRRQFRTQGEALTEKQRLEIEAADGVGTIRPVNTRLTPAQVASAETMFALTLDPLAAVQWFLANFRPPVVEMTLADERRRWQK